MSTGDGFRELWRQPREGFGASPGIAMVACFLLTSERFENLTPRSLNASVSSQLGSPVPPLPRFAASSEL